MYFRCYDLFCGCYFLVDFLLRMSWLLLLLKRLWAARCTLGFLLPNPVRSIKNRNLSRQKPMRGNLTDLDLCCLVQWFDPTHGRLLISAKHRFFSVRLKPSDLRLVCVLACFATVHRHFVAWVRRREVVLACLAFTRFLFLNWEGSLDGGPTPSLLRSSVFLGQFIVLILFRLFDLSIGLGCWCWAAPGFCWPLSLCSLLRLWWWVVLFIEGHSWRLWF